MDFPVSASGPSAVFPCGQDLEYDAEFLALQQAALGKSEQQFGDTIIPAEPPDWHEVLRLAENLSQRSTDLRIGGYAARALLGLQGLPGYALGLQRIVTELGQHWDHIHPALQVEDEFDPMPRINALQALADPQGSAREVRSARLLNGVHGQLSLRDAEAMLDGSRSDLPSYPGGRARLLSDLRQAWLQGEPEIMAIAQAHEALQALRELVVRQLGQEWAPNYDALLRTFEAVLAAARQDERPAHGQPGQTPAPDAPAGAGQDGAPAAAQAPALPAGAVRSREEAMALLTQVCRYFETYEPSHPAPFLLRRVQQTVPMDFHALLGNLAPQGLAQFEAWLPRDAAAQER
ncbi:type VI secretion system protein TssA [Orrella sp. JC864]|uniref:type VI secretion system protein TssA n=1 Tax=Orrella sp. JC864 TaxID=3120298 RepID=UPI00300995F9